jgi:hypothetical protein
MRESTLVTNGIDDESKIRPVKKADNSYFDRDADIGFPIWLDRETLEFIFSIRYNGPAFADSYLQEEYRIETHAVFSDIITDLIETKITSMKRTPWLYENKKRRPFRMDDLSNKNIIKIADSLGIHAADIDAVSVVAEVVESLEGILTDLITRRPGMSDNEKHNAIEFLDSQLWDEEAQLLWRNVSASMLAKMYDYKQLPLTIKIISYLDRYIRAQFNEGEMQGQDLKNALFLHLLSDDIMYRIFDALEDAKNDPDLPPEWVIPDAVGKAQEYDGNEYYC